MTKVQRLGSVESRAIVPTSSIRSYDQDIRMETTSEGILNMPSSWVDQCLENGFDMNPALQFDTLLDSLQPEDESMMGMKVEEVVMEVGMPTTAGSQPPAPASPESSDSSYHAQQQGAVPRHKRASHKRAELKRRDKIKTRLDELKALIPSIADKGKMSEVAVLSKAAEHKKHLMGQCEKFSTDAGNLRREIESLSTEIQELQGQLPAGGMKQEKVEKNHGSLDNMYHDYRNAATADNWKFYLFDYVAKSLFQTYKKEVSTDNVETFKASVEKWTNRRLSLTNLRHQTFENMRDISRQTAIMSNPASLPQEALASIPQPQATQSSASSPGDTRPLLAPVVSPPPSSFGTNNHVAAVCTSQLSGSPLVSAPNACGVSQLPVSVAALSSAGVGHLPSQVICAPVSGGSGGHLSVQGMSPPPPRSVVNQSAQNQLLATMVPSSSGVCQLPAQVICSPSSGVGHQLSAQLISAPASSGVPGTAVAPTTSTIARLLLADSLPSSSASSSSTGMDLSAPLTLTIPSSHGGHLASTLASTSSSSSTALLMSSSMAALSSAGQTAASLAMPQLFSSLPATQPYSPALLSYNPNMSAPQQAARGIVSSPQVAPTATLMSTTPSAACSVSSTVKDEEHGRSHYRLSKPGAGRNSSRKRASGSSQSSRGRPVSERGAAGDDESQPVVIRKRESLDLRTVAQLPVGAVSVFVSDHHSAQQHRSVPPEHSSQQHRSMPHQHNSQQRLLPDEHSSHQQRTMPNQHNSQQQRTLPDQHTSQRTMPDQHTSQRTMPDQHTSQRTMPDQRGSDRSVGGVPVDPSDIRQLAASVEGTSLYMNPPVAVVTSTTPHLEQPTSVAQLISDSQYLEYDFDISDIPLLDDL